MLKKYISIQLVLGIILIAISLWAKLPGLSAVIIALVGVGLVLHSFLCKGCKNLECEECEMPEKSKNKRKK